MVIISIPGFSGEVADGLGRVTVRVGNGNAGKGPVAKVMSELTSVAPLAH
jgi:hypothetical protein